MSICNPIPRLIPFILLLSMCSLPALHAQERFKASLVGGLTASQIDGDNSSGYHKLGFEGGAQVDVLLQKRTSASMGLLFAQRGSQSELIKNADNIAFFSLTLNYVDLPVLFHVHDWKVEDDEGEYYKASLDLGLAYSRLISSRSKDDLSAVTVVEPLLRKDAFNFVLGASLYANRHLGFSVKAVRGLGFIYYPSDYDAPPVKDHWYSHSLYFQAFYTF